MAPSTTLESRSSSDAQHGIIAIAVLVSISGAIIIALLIVGVMLIRQRRRRSANDVSYKVVPHPIRTHRVNLSDSSYNPLLVEELKADWDFADKVAPPTRRSTGDATREDREVLSDNPNGLYHVPSMRTPMTFSPTPSSNCLPHKTKAESDSPTSATTNQRRPLPPLPPLVISSYSYSQPWHPVPADEPLSPMQPLSRASSTSSCYSQPTLRSVPTTPEAFAEIPLSPELLSEAPSTEEGALQRGDTHLVGNLLKARAKRNPDGLFRTASQVSHIERTGSIKSIDSIHHDNRPYGKRYRSKKKKSTPVREMEVVNEGSEYASIRSRSDSTATAPWDPSSLIQMPPRAVSSPRSPPLWNA